MRVTVCLYTLCVGAGLAEAADRATEPTWLYRSLDRVQPAKADISGKGCHHKPLFGEGDSEARVAKGVARYGEIAVEPGGASAIVNYPREEQVYFVLEGEGMLHYASTTHPVRKDDFLYLPPGVPHGLSNKTSRRLRVIVMGFRIPAGTAIQVPPALQIANTSEVKKQVVGNHPPSTLYQLMMGDLKSTRDRLAPGHVLTSLFIMEFAPGGTNAPHHHPKEEEIYLLLDGEGEMVAGGGVDGVEGRHPAKPGDAYFFRLNCTVGFYNRSGPGASKAHILAIRSRYPGME